MTDADPGEIVAVYRINAAGPEYTDTDQNVWEADDANSYFNGSLTGF